MPAHTLMYQGFKSPEYALFWAREPELVKCSGETGTLQSWILEDSGLISSLHIPVTLPHSNPNLTAPSPVGSTGTRTDELQEGCSTAGDGKRGLSLGKGDMEKALLFGPHAGSLEKLWPSV